MKRRHFVGAVTSALAAGIAVADSRPPDMAKVVKAADFGAAGNSSTDDTAAIQAAVNALAATGGTVELSGLHLISGPIVLAAPGVFLRGENWYASKLVSTNATQAIVDIRADYCGIDNLGLVYDGPIPSSIAARAISVSAQNVSLTNFRIDNSGVGAYFEKSYVAHVSNFQIVGFTHAALFFTDWIDAYVSEFVIQASVGDAFGQLGGIFLDNAQAITAVNADILSGAHAIHLSRSSAYNNFCNIYCDSTYHDALFVDSGTFTKFTNCWFSGGRFAPGHSGAGIYNGDGIDFANCIFANNGAHGAFVGVGAKNTSFNQCRIESNSVTAGTSVAHGIAIDSGASDFTITNCVIRNGYFPGHQGYGIYITQGASDRFVITGNHLLGNNAPVFEGQAGTYQWVLDDSNLGYQKPHVSPVLSGGWAYYGGESATPGFLKDSQGFVHLRGAIKGGSIPSTVFTLPPGYRPAGTHDFPAISGDAFAWVWVDPRGEVHVQSGNNAFVSLAGITFKAGS